VTFLASKLRKAYTDSAVMRNTGSTHIASAGEISSIMAVPFLLAIIAALEKLDEITGVQ
jgi:hypothetical protein